MALESAFRKQDPFARAERSWLWKIPNVSRETRLDPTLCLKIHTHGFHSRVPKGATRAERGHVGQNLRSPVMSVQNSVTIQRVGETPRLEERPTCG